MPEFKTSNALVLSAKPFGERSYILSLLTAEHGRYVGVVKQKKAPEIGTLIQARWNARLAEHMGTFYIEESVPFSIQFLDDKDRLNCVACLCALADMALPEREPQSDFYHKTLHFLHHLTDNDFLKRYVIWELDLLTVLGFGLDFSGCAGGGDATDLAYVSPNTGRSVCTEKGLPYHDKLLRLPAFLWKEAPATLTDIANGLKITAFFLNNNALHKPLPLLRERLVS